MNKSLKLLTCFLFIAHSLESNCQLWTQVQRISKQSYYQLGYSMDYDGKNLITANGGNITVIFHWKDSGWVENRVIDIPDFDTMVSVSISNNWAAIGTGGEWDVQPIYMYFYDGINWLDAGNIIPTGLSAGDKFGCSISMNDRFMVIGAAAENDSSSNGGGVYVYKKNGLSWILYQKLFPKNGLTEKNFGFCSALSGDNLIIGAKSASYIYSWNGSSWIEQLKIPIQTSSVDISDKYAIVGSTTETKIYVKVNNIWIFQQSIIGTVINYYLANKKLVSVDGETLIVNKDIKYIFSCTANFWTEKQRITNEDYYSNSIIYKNQLFISSPGDIPGFHDWDGTGPSTGAIYYYQFKLNQSIEFPAIQNKTYGENAFSLEVSSNSGLPVKLISNKESVAKILNNQIDIKNAGTCEISAIQNGDSIYLPADTIRHTLIVNKASISAVANNFTKTYGDPNPNFNLSYHDFVNGDDENDIDIFPQAVCSATLSSNVGTYSISATGGLDNNYFFNYVNGELTINKAVITATAENKSKIYGEINPAFSISFSGFKNYETPDVINSLPQASSDANILSDVGTYPILLSAGSDDNYEFSYIPGNLEIGKAMITASADNKVKYYGDVNPPLTLSYTGFRNNDTQSKLDKIPSILCSADQNSDVGFYDIIASNGLDNNYSFSYNNGQLLINKALLSIQAENKTKHFGDPNPEFTLHYTGFKNEDEASVLDDLPEVFCYADSSSVEGNYPISVSGGSDNNYQFFYVNGQLTVLGISTDISNFPGISELYFYPNPVQDGIQIVNSNNLNLHITLTSLTGRIIMQKIVNNSYVEFHNLENGIYILDIDGRKFKLIKSK